MITPVPTTRPAAAATTPSRVPAARPVAAATIPAAPAGDTLVTTPPVTPAAPVHADGSVPARDGQTVGYRTTSSVGATRAVVVMQQGTYGEPRFFDPMGEKLADKGIKSYAVGSRVTSTDSTIHADDLDRVVALARRENPGVPVTVMGVSLGAAITMDWNASHNPAHLPVVLMSPVIFPKYMGVGDLGKVAAGLVSKRAGQAMVNSPMSKGAPLTTNPDSPEAHLANPQAMKVTANLFDDVVKMVGRAALAGRRSTGPMLLLEAGNDQVAANAVTRPFMGLIRADKTTHTFPGAAHDLSQESHRADVVDTLSGWVLKQH